MKLHLREKTSFEICSWW